MFLGDNDIFNWPPWSVMVVNYVRISFGEDVDQILIMKNLQAFVNFKNKQSMGIFEAMKRNKITRK